MAKIVVLLVLLAGFASQGGRATVTYQPTPLKGDGQGCPSDEEIAQVIGNIHSLIEENIEKESTPEGRLLIGVNTAVETLNQKVTDLSNTTNGTLAELRQEVADLSNTTNGTLVELYQEVADLSNTTNGTLVELRQEVTDLSSTSQTVNGMLAELRQEVTDLSSTSQTIDGTLAELIQELVDLSVASQTVNGALAELREEVTSTSQTVNGMLAELRQEVTDLSSTSQTVDGTLAELNQELVDLSLASQTVNGALAELHEEVTSTSQTVNGMLAELRQEVTDLSSTSQTVDGTLAELNQALADLSAASQTVNGMLAELSQQVSELSSTSQTLLGGLNEQIPAASCRQIFENRPDLPSGYYWIRNSDGTAVQLYCDMAKQCCNEVTGGWTRIANLNMTDPNQQCPPEWTLIDFPKRTCGRFGSGCESVMFTNDAGTSYSRVCGRVIAYQLCRPEAFDRFNDGLDTSIDAVYVDGVSITHGSPRQHVWTFAAARDEEYDGDSDLACPCTNTDNIHNVDIQIPPFVGDDYFCDTALPAFVSTCSIPEVH